MGKPSMDEDEKSSASESVSDGEDSDEQYEMIYKDILKFNKILKDSEGSEASSKLDLGTVAQLSKDEITQIVNQVEGTTG